MGALSRSIRGLVFVVALAGCAGSHPEQPPIAFINHTVHADVVLWNMWTRAQQSVASRIDLNPVQRVLSNAPPDIRPGDSRGLKVWPHQLLVEGQPDVSSSLLLQGTGVHRADPTGMIACPQPCNVRYATAYSLYDPALVAYAASWENYEENFNAILEYEFENQILFALGYDVRWR